MEKQNIDERSESPDHFWSAGQLRPGSARQAVFMLFPFSLKQHLHEYPFHCKTETAFNPWAAAMCKKPLFIKCFIYIHFKRYPSLQRARFSFQYLHILKCTCLPHSSCSKETSSNTHAISSFFFQQRQNKHSQKSECSFKHIKIQTRTCKN